MKGVDSMTKEEKAKVNLMEKLGCTEEEALDIIKWDKEIDKGNKAPFDLSKDQEKAIKKYVNCGDHKKPTVYKFDTRERKENTVKAGIIADLARFLTENGKKVDIINKERQISFSLDGETYEITLVQKRKPKK